MNNKTKVHVYLNTSVVYTYEVNDPMKGREHAAAIIASGYRHTPKNSEDMEWYPPHAIVKVVVKGGAESSQYKDTARAT